MTKEQIEQVVKVMNERYTHYRLLQCNGIEEALKPMDLFNIENGNVMCDGAVILSEERIKHIPNDFAYGMGTNNLTSGFYTSEKNKIESEEEGLSDEAKKDAMDIMNRLHSSLCI